MRTNSIFTCPFFSEQIGATLSNGRSRSRDFLRHKIDCTSAEQHLIESLFFFLEPRRFASHSCPLFGGSFFLAHILTLYSRHLPHCETCLFIPNAENNFIYKRPDRCWLKVNGGCNALKKNEEIFSGRHTLKKFLLETNPPFVKSTHQRKYKNYIRRL